MSAEELDDIAVENFRTYLRFSTVHPNPDYTSAINWLRNEGDKVGLDCFLTEPIPNNPVLVMRWLGSCPSLRSVMLNSHMDVVPVERDKWSYDPFGAIMDSNGNIFGRGAQDMKSVGIQHLESIRRLKLEGFVPRRTIYLTFVPNEEVGGACGMEPFVEGVKPSPTAPNEISFADMNVGLCFDEGMSSSLPDVFYVFYEERSPCWVEFRIPGNVGHGSRFIENTAVEKLNRLLTRLLAFRQSQKDKLESMGGGDLVLGNVVTCNINVINGGVAINIVPSEFKIMADFRLPPTLNFNTFEEQLNKWVTESGEGIQVNYIREVMSASLPGGLPKPCDMNDPILKALRGAARSVGAKIEMGIAYGSTDARFLRRWHTRNGGKAPIRAFGFSPMCDTPPLLHDHNEYLNKKVFLKGIEVFKQLISEIAMMNDI